ncbi:MAG TPA: hypothetical protein DGL25_06400 [Dehalococcoidia bacterium]|nr:hypothetical protein [Dehalococcoidia bacterium]
MCTLGAVSLAGLGLRLLLAARVTDTAIAPPSILVLGSVAAAAIGLAFTPFALAGALPTALGVIAFLVVVVALISTIGAWLVIRRLS